MESELNEMLGELRRGADKIIDTSSYSVHQLKEVLEKYYLEAEGKRLNITLISFGYKYGVPYDADLIFDVRFM